MKDIKITKNMLLIAAVAILVIAVIILSYFYFFKNINKKWVAKIDGSRISLEDFNTRYDYYLKSKFMDPKEIEANRINPEEKSQCLRDMINEQLIINEARKQKLHTKDEVKQLMKMYTQQIVLQYYIDQNIGHRLNVSDPEIDNYYREKRAEFANLDPEMARNKIRYMLMLRKMDEELSVVLAKLNEKAKILRNESLISAFRVPSDSVSPLSTPPMQDMNKGSSILNPMGNKDNESK